LHERDDLEEELTEAGGFAERGVAREPDGGLPGGDAEDAEQPDEGRARREVPPAARHGHNFARKIGPSTQISRLRAEPG